MKQRSVPDTQIEYCQLLADLGAKNLPPGGEPLLASLLAKASELSSKPNVVVDVGCNTGWVTIELARAFPDSQVFGCDIDSAMIAACDRRVKGMDQPPTNVSFEVTDCVRLKEVIPHADLIVCAGSTAFFPDRRAALSAISAVLGDGGIFCDVNYIYTASPSRSLIERQHQLYGVTAPDDRLVDWLETYSDSGLLLHTFERYPQFSLVDNVNAEFFRELFSSLPGMAGFADEMVLRRKLSNELAEFRYPGQFWLKKATADQRSEDPIPAETLLSFAKTLMLFRSAIPRMPLEGIRKLNPYEFLAYIGDPDSAPGGASSVRAVAETLQRLGLSESATLLDIGCFTGLSTLVLGRHFPRVIGIDISPESVRVARDIAQRLNSRITLEVGDARSLARPAGSVDAVVMTATLGYSPNPDQLVREARRVLKDEGLFVEFLYDYPGASSELLQEVRDRVSDDIRLTTLHDQIRWIEELGFQCIYAQLTELVVDERVAQLMLNFVYDLEVQENPHLAKSEWAEFQELMRQYSGELEHASYDPRAYLCVFRASCHRGVSDTGGQNE